MNPIWMRHAGDRYFHSISSMVFSGSTTTRCRGRWPSKDNETCVEESDNPPHHERCDECVRVLVGERVVARGLDELVANTNKPAVDFSFDMTDLEDA